MRISTKTALAFALFALACVGVSGTLLARQAQASLEEAIVARQRLLAESRALVLRENLALATGELERLTHMAAIDLEDGDFRPEQRLLAQAYHQTPFFNSTLELYGRHGRCRWAEPEERPCLSRDASESSWFRATMASGESSHLYAIDPDGRGLVDIVVPIERHDEVVGVMRGVVDLQHDQMFSPVLSRELPESTAVALIDLEGRPLFVIEPPGMADDVWRVARRGLESGATGSAFVTTSSKRMLVAWSPVGRAELGLALAWPWEQLDESAERLTRELSWLMAIVAVLALATGFVVARRLTRPLTQLAADVRGMRDEPIPTLRPSARTDEIGELERAFVALLDALAERELAMRAEHDRVSELALELEDRVEERTEELRAAQAALVGAERLAAIGRAGTVLSHELRNTLNAISVAMDTLASDASDPVKREARQLVRGEIARLRTLSDDLLTYAKEPALKLRDVDLAELIATAVLLTEDQAARASVAIESDLEPGLSLHADPDRVQSALVNLIHNAIEAAGGRTGARVRLVARSEPDAITIRVEDSGPGVSPEIVERLFQPFVTSRPQGIGLGLPIAERFVRAHGGTIELGEGALGGACFLVRVPRAASEESA